MVLALEPEELAGVVLEYLNAIEASDPGRLNRYNFGLPHTVAGYPGPSQTAVGRALMEAWVWLEREGLITPQPGKGGLWIFVTRRGKALSGRSNLDAFRRADLLPRHLLHPVIAQRVWSQFLRGEYDTAVFQAFKEVEVAVREASNYGSTDIGADLMRKAFNEAGGPLRDPSAPVAEQQALAHLFAGAIGSYKNPHSHRTVSIADPTEAVEMIVLASHLLRIVQDRKDKLGLGAVPKEPL